MPTDLMLLGQLVRELQAEMRTLRSENRLIREELATKISRDEFFRAMTLITNRFAEFEAHTDKHFDEIKADIAENKATVARIESMLAAR